MGGGWWRMGQLWRSWQYWPMTKMLIVHDFMHPSCFTCTCWAYYILGKSISIFHSVLAWVKENNWDKNWNLKVQFIVTFYYLLYFVIVTMLIALCPISLCLVTKPHVLPSTPNPLQVLSLFCLYILHFQMCCRCQFLSPSVPYLLLSLSLISSMLFPSFIPHSPHTFTGASFYSLYLHKSLSPSKVSMCVLLMYVY